MTKPLRLDSEAEEELVAAVEWYERRRPGLGADFLAAVEEASQRVLEHPRAGARIPGVSDSAGALRALVHKFPYAIVYAELDEEIRILAFAHASRRPGYWRYREK